MKSYFSINGFGLSYWYLANRNDFKYIASLGILFDFLKYVPCFCFWFFLDSRLSENSRNKSISHALKVIIAFFDFECCFVNMDTSLYLFGCSFTRKFCTYTKVFKIDLLFYLRCHSCTFNV